jgi:hypothetical protein
MSVVISLLLGERFKEVTLFDFLSTLCSSISITISILGLASLSTEVTEMKQPEKKLETKKEKTKGRDTRFFTSSEMNVGVPRGSGSNSNSPFGTFAMISLLLSAKKGKVPLKRRNQQNTVKISGKKRKKSNKTKQIIEPCENFPKSDSQCVKIGFH